MTQILILSLALAYCADATVVTWATTPVFPSEVLVLHGDFGGDPAGCLVNVSTTSVNVPRAIATLPVSPGQAASWSIKVVLPADLPVDAYALSVVCPGGDESSPVIAINAAEAWWFQGDVGNAATPGGWLRVLGPVLALALPGGNESGLLAAIRDIRDAMAAPLRGGDPAWDDASPLAALAEQLIALRAALAALPIGLRSRSTTLRLNPINGGSPVYLVAGNASAHAAHFLMPADLVPGEYAVAVSNGYGANTDGQALGSFVPVVFFESAARPAVATIAVQPSKMWPPGIFDVVGGAADPCVLPCPTSDAAFEIALNSASAAGGGTVRLPLGRFFLTAPLSFPPNTRLVGAGTGATAVWFAEWNKSTAPTEPLLSLNDSAAIAGNQAAAMGASGPGEGRASWGVSGFTLYITAFHNTVFYVSNHTDGFAMTGMRLRLNPFAFTWGTGPALSSRGRIANWTVNDIGVAVEIHGTNNVISDNDLWAVGKMLNSFSVGFPTYTNEWPSFRCGHEYSFMARNVIYGGTASHFMHLWRQVIFEQNVVIGAIEVAGGQSLGTGPDGGVAQHVYHADNRIQFTWGGDREVMTYDDAGGAYYGALASVEGTTVTLANDAWPAGSWQRGAWSGSQIMIINGTGATQSRRIVVPGVNTTNSTTNRTWIVDMPFDIAPDVGPAGSFVEIFPFRGRNIFHRDFNIDTGPHQFYGHAVSNLVTDIKFERVRGLMAWGQWRGWVPPPRPDEEPRLQGLMGNGWQPNVHNQYRGVHFTEGNPLVNYNCGQGGYVEFWAGKSVVLYPGGMLPNLTSTSIHPLHMGLIFRGTRMQASSAGFWVGNDSSDVVIEGSEVEHDGGSCIIMGLPGQVDLVYESANNCSL